MATAANAEVVHNKLINKIKNFFMILLPYSPATGPAAAPAHRAREILITARGWAPGSASPAANANYQSLSVTTRGLDALFWPLLNFNTCCS